MIIDDDGNKKTPKEVAREIILDAISAKAGYWGEEEDGFVISKRLTAREIDLINDQIDKQYIRIQKLFGHSGWGLS